MNAKQKYEIITRGLQEVAGKEHLMRILEHRNLRIYWGTAPTGKIHLGYMAPMLKLVDYIKTDCEVTILFADIHAYLDSMKSTLDKIEFRCTYYQKCIRAILESLNVDCSKIRFIKGSEFQLKPKYTMDVYKFHSHISINAAKHAGAEVVKQSNNPMITSLLYPGLQALDEVYLDVDAQHGGIDQRKIFMYANEILPKLGYRQCIHLMNKMVPGLRTEAIKNSNTEQQNNNIEQQNNNTEQQKMSASIANSKIDMMDSEKTIKQKINTAYCKPGIIEDNCIIDLLRNIVFPYLEYMNKEFIVDRGIKYGGPIKYMTVDELSHDFSQMKLHPADLKNATAQYINMIIEPVREKLGDSVDELLKSAYE